MPLKVLNVLTLAENVSSALSGIVGFLVELFQ